MAMYLHVLFHQGKVEPERRGQNVSKHVVIPDFAHHYFLIPSYKDAEVALIIALETGFFCVLLERS